MIVCLDMKGVFVVEGLQEILQPIVFSALRNLYKLIHALLSGVTTFQN